MSDAFTSDTYDALCKEAEDYLSRGLAEQARELLLKAISLIGTRPKARSLLADCCMSLGLWSEARAQLETLTTLDVGSSSHHFRLGQVMEEMGEYALARDNYSVVLEHEPDNHAAAVALNRLKDRPDSAEPEEIAEEEAGQPEEAVRRAGDMQVYPDDESEEGVFASASEDDVEKLLKDIGVAPAEAEGEEGTDVAELLSSMGIDLGDSSKKKQQQTRDISEILGGEGARQAEAGEEETADAEAPGAEEPQQAEETQEGPSLDAIFGGPPKEPEEPQAAAEDEEEEEGETSLEAIFGGAEEEAQEEESPAEEEAGEEPVAEEEMEKEEPPAEEEPAEEKEGPSLAAIFGGAPAPGKEEAEGEKAPEEERAEAQEPPEEAVAEEQAEEEPVAEEEMEKEEPPEEEEPAEEKEGPSLAAIFGGAPAPGKEEDEGEKAPEEEGAEAQEPPEEAVAEEQAEEEAVAEEPAAEEEMEKEEPPAEEAPEDVEPGEEPAGEKTGPSLASIFGGAGTEAGEEEPEEAAEEEAGAEERKAGPSLSSIFGGGPEKKEEAEEEPVGEETPAEELPEEAEEKAEEPSAEEAPRPEEEPAEEEAPAGRKAGIVCHRPAPESVAVVYLEDVEVVVTTGILAAADGSLEASEEDGTTLLRGSGRAWIGDGAAVPVSLSVSDGLRVRPGRLALRQSSVELEEADGNGLAGVGGEGSLALLAGGRFRWLSCTGGDGCLRISGESMVAVEGDVKLEPAEDAGEGFLLASGEGRVLISC
ncbi:MAG: tetratricopeptide repeat protein [Candidatus Fermentibacteraceae bacterium]